MHQSEDQPTHPRMSAAGGDSASAAWQRAVLQVRAAATASVTEAEFVRRLRRGGMAIWSQASTGAGDAGGYALEAVIGSGLSCTDVELADELALPVLRHDWDPSDCAATVARTEWRGLRRSHDQDRDRVVLTDPVVWSRMFSDAGRFHAHLRLSPVSGGEQRWATTRLAGAIAAWAVRAEPDTAGPLSEAALHAGTAATAGVPPVAPGSRLTVVAYGLSQLDTIGLLRAPEALLLAVQLVSAAVELSQAHRRRGELHRAELLAHAATCLDTYSNQLHRHLRRPPECG